MKGSYLLLVLGVVIVIGGYIIWQWQRPLPSAPPMLEPSPTALSPQPTLQTLRAPTPISLQPTPTLYLRVSTPTSLSVQPTPTAMLSPTATALSEQPTPTPMPSGTATSPSFQTAPTPSPLATATPLSSQPTPTPASTTLTIYFPKMYEEGRLVLVAVKREVVGNRSPALAALEAYVAGPTEGEKAAGLLAPLRPGTQVRGLEIRDGTAYADFNEGIGKVFGAPFSAGVFWGIVHTLTEFSDIQQVVLLEDGKEMRLFGDPALEIGPASRDRCPLEVEEME